MTYNITPEKLQELNVLIDKGGHVPGDVSNALAALEVAIAAGDKVAAKKAFDQAVNANINGNAKAWTAVQGWHDQVKAAGEGGGEPVTPLPPAVAGQLTAGQAQQHLPLAANQIANWDCMTDLDWSYAIAPSGDGQAYWYVGAEKLTDVNDPRWLGYQKGSIPWTACKAGQKASAYYKAIDGQTLRVDAYPPKSKAA